MQGIAINIAISAANAGTGCDGAENDVAGQYAVIAAAVAVVSPDRRIIDSRDVEGEGVRASIGISAAVDGV